MSVAVAEIKTEAGATIAVSLNGGDFSDIGTGEAVFESSSVGILEVLAYSNQGETRGQVEIRLGETTTIKLVIAASAQAEAFAPGGVSYLHVAEPFIYGLSPKTSEITVRSTQADAFSGRYFFDIPKLRRLHWYNEGSFIYSTLLDQTVGLMTPSGLLTLEGQVGFAALDNSAITATEQGEVIKLSVPTGQTEVLFNLDGYRPSQVFADEDYIYLPLWPTVSDGGDAHNRLTTINIYTHGGELIKQLQTLHSGYVQILESAGLVFLATAEGLEVYDLEGGAWQLEFSLPEAIASLAKTDLGVYVLGQTTGLWLLDPESDSAQYALVAAGNGPFIANSLLIQAGSAYFSDKDTIYRLKLDSN